MKAGTFNINEYLERLTEEAEVSKAAEKTPDKEGLIIPDSNEKAYKWLQSEYKKGQTEVKVEMHIGDKKFNPGYELQTNLKSVKDFKPGMFGQAGKKDSVDGLKTTNFGGKETKQDNPKDAEAKPTPKPAENLPKPATAQKPAQKPAEKKTVSGMVKSTGNAPKAAPTATGAQKPAAAPAKFKIKKATVKTN